MRNNRFRFPPLNQAVLNAMFLGGLLLLAMTAMVRQDSDHDLVQSLHASATDSGSSFIMATGQIDESVEGVFFLDRTLGTLQCWVLNKNNGDFVAKLGYMNVFNDVGEMRDKNPTLLMTTGNYFAGGGAGPGGRAANCMVYVLNENTGQFAVYGFPWNAMLHGKRGPAFVGPMRLVNKGMTRDPDPETFREP